MRHDWAQDCSRSPNKSAVLVTGPTEALLDRAPNRNGMRAEWLLTPTVSHADAAESVTFGELWKLLRFWKKIFT